MKWWRKLPGWHRREVEFREWYIQLLGRVNLSNDTDYQQALDLLSSPERVSGYREIRYPKMNAERTRVEAELTPVRAQSEAEASSLLDALRTPTRV